MKAGRQRTRGGFTLIELLIAFSIVAFVMTIATQILHTTLVGADVIHNLSESERDGPAVMGIIERDLRGLVVYNVQSPQVFLGRDDGDSGDRLDFLSTRDSLLPSRIDGQDHVSDVCEIGYRLLPKRSADGDYGGIFELYRRESLHVDADPFEGGRYDLLHGWVQSMNFVYYDEEGEDAEPLDAWDPKDHEGRLPLRLGVELVLELRMKEIPATMDAPREIWRRAPEYRRTWRLPEPSRVAVATGLRPTIPPPPQEGPTTGDQLAGAAAFLGAGGAGDRGPGGSGFSSVGAFGGSTFDMGDAGQLGPGFGGGGGGSLDLGGLLDGLFGG